MTWTSFHRRGTVLREVLTAAETRRDGLLPTDVPGVAETFHDDLDLLAALQLRWHTRLAGQVERGLAGQPIDLEHAVAAAWHRAANESPGVRLVLDRYREHPADAAMASAMATATRKEHAMLALMAGLAGIGDDGVAAPHGARIEALGRALSAAVPLAATGTRVDSGQRGLIGRLRAAFAA